MKETLDIGDRMRNKLKSQQRLVCEMTIRDGMIVYDLEGLL